MAYFYMLRMHIQLEYIKFNKLVVPDLGSPVMKT